MVIKRKDKKMMNELLKTIMEPITYENINELKPGDWIWDGMQIEKEVHVKTKTPNPHINPRENYTVIEQYGFRQIHTIDETAVNAIKNRIANSPFQLSVNVSQDAYEWIWFEHDKDRFYKFKNNTLPVPANNDLIKKTTEDIKDRLYNALMNAYDKLDSVKHDLSCIYEGACKDLNILESNSKEDRYRELLFEILELTRNKLCSSGEFDDWKDADDWLFSKLSLTKSELADVYRGRSIVYIESVKEG